MLDYYLRASPFRLALEVFGEKGIAISQAFTHGPGDASLSPASKREQETW